MDGEVFQSIFDTMVDYLPEGWKKLVLFVGYTEGSSNICFYVKDKHGNYTGCYNMPGLSENMAFDITDQIEEITLEERKKLPKDKRWTIMTMMVESDGEMKTEFDYDDHTEDMVKFQIEWEKQYLV